LSSFQHIWNDFRALTFREASVWPISPKLPDHATEVGYPATSSKEQLPIPATATEVIDPTRKALQEVKLPQSPVGTVDLNMFKAVQGRNKPTQDVWMLRADQIEILEDLD
jgi:hypothetical protein